MQLLLLTLAAVCFATGGLLMKLSQGVTRPLPTAGFLALFLAGAVVQAVAMRHADLGVAYIIVLGLEAGLTVVFSAALLREAWPAERVLAVALIVAGVLLLRRT